MKRNTMVYFAFVLVLVISLLSSCSTNIEKSNLSLNLDDGISNESGKTIAEVKNKEEENSVMNPNSRINRIANYIKSGEFDNARLIYISMTDSELLNMPVQELVMLHFLNALEGDEKVQKLRWLSKISSDYRGTLWEQIDEYKKQYFDRDTWLKMESDMIKETIEFESQFTDKVKPTIGMTEEEVLESYWGKPQDKNKTTTKYGVSEQWVYSTNRYVYFEDGIVTSIQE